MSVVEHTIELAGSPVFYRSAPATDPTPLYLHGIPTSSDDWLPFLERIGGIAPDLPGFGRTGKAANLDYTIEGHARFLEQLMDALAVPRFALVAHGWGAAAGLAYAQRNPGRVTRLVLVNAVPLFPAQSWPRIARLWRRPLVGELVMGATTKWLLARALRRGGRFDGAAIDTIWRQFDQGTQRAILRLHRAADEGRLVEAGAHLDALPVPALVIWGERDPWLPPDLARSYTERLPEAELELVAEGGHWPWQDDVTIVERVARFLARG